MIFNILLSYPLGVFIPLRDLLRPLFASGIRHLLRRLALIDIRLLLIFAGGFPPLAQRGANGITASCVVITAAVSFALVPFRFGEEQERVDTGSVGLDRSVADLGENAGYNCGFVV